MPRFRVSFIVGFLNERRPGLWLLDIESEQLTRLTGDARWHDHSAQFSTDGQQIVFASDRSEDALEGSMQQDLFIYRLVDANVERVQTLPGQASQPQWSPDGRQLLYHYQADYFEPQQLVVHQLTDGSNRIIANDWDRHANSSAWSGHKLRLRAITQSEYDGFKSNIPAVYIAATNDRLVPVTKRQEFVQAYTSIAFAEIDGPHFILQANPKDSAAAILNAASLILNKNY